VSGTIQYRVYTLSPENRITGSNTIECRGDDEAIEKTRQILDGHDLELWSGPKLIGRFKSKDTSP
jgi:hypothetical protein